MRPQPASVVRLGGCFDRRAKTKRYPPRDPPSHLAIRAIVDEDRPVLSLMALYCISSESRRAASKRLENSLISIGVIRSRRNLLASFSFWSAKIPATSCLFSLVYQSVSDPISLINRTVFTLVLSFVAKIPATSCLFSLVY